MKEDLLHFIWHSRTLMKHKNLQTYAGEPLQIIHPGTLNNDAGPDFFNAKVKIGNTLWAGNVEIHLRSSDWKNHRHDGNKVYDSVILHVVYHQDVPVCYGNGNPIPTLELRNFIPPLMLRKYRHLQLNRNTIACEKLFLLPPQHALANWMERLLTERLQDKCEHIQILLNQHKNHWEETFYILTARYFGMKTNAQPFEWLAQNLPLTVIARHKNSLLHIQALVFGVAGFLEEKSGNVYIDLLKREFDFFRRKYNLVALDKSIWKFARTRPANFPTVRLAQLASLIFRSSHLFSKIIGANTLHELKNLYRVEPDKKLDPFAFITHETKAKATELGTEAIESILINTVLPVLFLYGRQTQKEELCERTLRFYEELPAEDNTIIRFWHSLGIPVRSAFETQALIQLKNRYCAELNCLSCIIGKQIILNGND
jgi:hypothetical protein